LLSSTGLAYRRCELFAVNGAEIDVQFLRAETTRKSRAIRQIAGLSPGPECIPPESEGQRLRSVDAIVICLDRRSIVD